MSRKYLYHIGVDEAGRGSLAGPVALAVVIMRPEFLKRFRGVKDSKKLSRMQREHWFKVMLGEKKKGNIDFKVSLVGNKLIDRYGISRAIKIGIRESFYKINTDPQRSSVFLDGLLKAPKEFIYQKTYIRGDERFKVISLASIAAKVTRDEKMRKLSLVYPKYNFYLHKGYGTPIHLRLIKKHHPSVIHRLSFLKGILTTKL